MIHHHLKRLLFSLIILVNFGVYPDLIEQFQMIGSTITDKQDNGYSLVGYTYKSFTSEAGYAMCWAECKIDNLCKGLNFNIVTGFCELNRRSRYVVPSKNFIQRNESIHYSVHGIPEECQVYQNLSESDRNIKNNVRTKPLACDKTLKSGWYRFVGPAGKMLLNSCPSKKCRTSFQIWMNGEQPKPGEVQVTRQSCKQGNNKCCLWPREIKATYCGHFIVYHLTKTNCNVRYCGMD